MKLRIEFIQSRSPAFKNTLRLAKRVKTFKQFDEEGVTIYSIEFELNEIGEFEAFRQMTNWKGRAFFINGKLAGGSRINDIVYNNLYKDWYSPKEEWRRPGRKLIDGADLDHTSKPYDARLN